MKNLLTPLLYICVGALLSTMLTRSCSKQTKVLTEIVKTDTVIVAKVDTIVKIQPQPYRVEVRDTITISDTIYIGGQTLYQEVKEYKDSTYYARISGINAFLEHIEVYPKTTTKYIYQVEKVTEKPKKWGIGPQVGIGIVNNQFYPYIGFGVQYSIMRF